MSSITWILLLACTCSVLVTAARGPNASERKSLIAAAIEEVRNYEDMVKMSSMGTKNGAKDKLRSFKMSTPGARAQGNARLRFERMVKAAEKKILNSQRQVSVQQDKNALAESLAYELLHKPGQVLTVQEINDLFEESECAELVHHSVECNFYDILFRTADGTCNNLIDTTFGAAETPLGRLLPARYDDGVSRPRGFLQSIGAANMFPSQFSPPVPSARVVSTGIVLDREVNDDIHSHLLMQWGQFVDHDLDFVPEHEHCPDGCSVDTQLESSCYPIPVPDDDANILVTRANGATERCHEFRRSLGVCQEPVNIVRGDDISVRQQMNAINHFLDGSMVYHHNETVQRTLIRNLTSDEGLLNVALDSSGPEQDFLPFIDTIANPDVVGCPKSPCFLGGDAVGCPKSPCFLGGDARVNEQTALTVMHTIWVREHNRIAKELGRLNSDWSGNIIYETARTIVVAMIQKITYKDFLPELLGTSFSLPDYQGYDSSVLPRVPNAFATAAYRFGHSLIQPQFDRLDRDFEPAKNGPLSLVDAFFDSSSLTEGGGTDPILRGLLVRNARRVDEFLNSILTNMLFADNPSSPGMDLASLNIQRGRDHGLPPYVFWKQWAEEQCGLKSDFRNSFTMMRLNDVYGTSEDNVDLFVGGLAESPIQGGIVGATFSCIFAKTFTALRDGDRFYYENTELLALTPAQRAEIEHSSLSRVICDNTDDIKSIQPNAFLTTQTRVNCSKIPSVDLNQWELEDPGCEIGVSYNGRHSRVPFFLYTSEKEGGTYRFTRRVLTRRRRRQCISIKCPTEESPIHIVAGSPERDCQVEETDGSSLNQPRFFPSWFTNSSPRSFIRPRPVNPRRCIYDRGLVITCSARYATSQNDDARAMHEVDVTVDSAEKLLPLLDDRIRGILNDGEKNKIISEEQIQSSDADPILKTKTSQDELISLMEDVLAKLQQKEEKEEATSSNENVLSKLEKLLKVN